MDNSKYSNHDLRQNITPISKHDSLDCLVHSLFTDLGEFRQAMVKDCINLFLAIHFLDGVGDSSR